MKVPVTEPVQQKLLDLRAEMQADMDRVNRALLVLDSLIEQGDDARDTMGNRALQSLGYEGKRKEAEALEGKLIQWMRTDSRFGDMGLMLLFAGHSPIVYRALIEIGLGQAENVLSEEAPSD